MSIFRIIILAIKFWWLLAYPLDEFLHFTMVTDSLDRVVMIIEFLVGKRMVKFCVTDVMQQHQHLTSSGLRYYVMI